MLKCKDITTEAHKLIDGEHGFVKRARVRFHLLICTHCKRYYEQLLATLDVLKSGKLTDNSATAPTDAEVESIVKKLKLEKLKLEKLKADQND